MNGLRGSRGRRCAIAIVFAAFVCSWACESALAAGTPKARPSHSSGLSQLWRTYPLGTARLAPPAKTTEPKPTPAQPSALGSMAPAPVRSATPAIARHDGSPAFSFTMLALLVLAATALVVATSLRHTRRRRTAPTVDLALALAPYGAHAAIDRGIHVAEELISMASAGVTRRRAQRTGTVASRSLTCNKAFTILARRRKTVANSSDSASAAAKGKGGSSTDAGSRKTYADIGDRVADVIQAAEQVAEQIRLEATEQADAIRLEAERTASAWKESALGDSERIRAEAEQHAATTRESGDAYSADRRREAEDTATRLVTDAETQARITREAAEEMGRRIAGAARTRQREIQEQSGALEARLHQLLEGARDVSARLEHLLRDQVEEDAPESLAEALSIARRD